MNQMRIFIALLYLFKPIIELSSPHVAPVSRMLAEDRTRFVTNCHRGLQDFNPRLDCLSSARGRSGAICG